MEPVFEPRGRANILVIVTDDQPFYTLSASAMPKTLAALGGGLRFTNSYAAIPVCGPSRTSLMTGLYMHNHRIFRNLSCARIFKDKGYHYQALGHKMSQADYTCGYFGKYLNDYEEIPLHVAPGYDYWGVTFQSQDPVRANIQGRLRVPTTLDGTVVRAAEETTWVSSRVVRFIQDAREPFFCVAGLQGPHSPYNVSAKNAGVYQNQTMPLRQNFDYLDTNKPTYVQRPALTATEKTRFLNTWRGKMGELLDVDDAVERMCAAVDFETTYVFFLTDNGYLLGEHRQEAKSAPYEESTKSPFVVRGPGVRSGTDDRLISHVDVAPTCYEVAGLEEEAEKTDGRSLLGAMMTDTAPKRDYLLIERSMAQWGETDDLPAPWRAIRSQNQLYVEYKDGQKELYDMVNDPYQLSNRIPQGGLRATSVADSERALSDRLAMLKSASGRELRAAEVDEVVQDTDMMEF